MKMVTVYLLGKKFSVPEDLTIMRAMEYSGFHLIRGIGAVEQNGESILLSCCANM